MSPQPEKPAVWSRLPALHYRDFRLMWFGLFVSTVGSQMQFTAVNWHVYQLLNGQSVTLPDGRVIQPEAVLGEAQRGAKLCFVGDVSHTGSLHKEVEEADLLAIEATYLEADKELARAHGHITAAAAARLARNSGVKQLVLHHVSRRYTTQEIVAEAQAIFPNTYVARDFDHFQIVRGGATRVSKERVSEEMVEVAGGK